MTSTEYAITSAKRRGNQIKIVLKSIARPANRKHSPPSKQMPQNEASPMLAFFSGPGFESREMELDLRDLVGINVNDLDDSLKDILQDDQITSSVADADESDNVSLTSEISTCSSAVTVALEPVDEEPSHVLAKYKPSCSPTPMRNYEPASSSETEEEHEGRKSGRKGKKIAHLFSFNSGIPSPASYISEQQHEQSMSSSLDRKRMIRRPSLTRKKTPLGLAIFSNATGQNSSEIKTEHSDKENKKQLGNQAKGSRKSSLNKNTNSQSSKAIEKQDGKTKRRHTDPNVVHGRKTDSESEGTKSTLEAEDANSPERIRKVSFNSLGPSVEQQQKDEMHFQPEDGSFKDEDIKLRYLIGSVLRSHMLSMVDYRKETCDRTSKSISKILKTLIESMKESEGIACKVVCNVFIGAVRDQGIFMSTQALWDSSHDNFAAASFRNEAVFGLVVVIAAAYN